ncbi:MAG: hypothetical protein ACFB9N_07540 [Geitlerinemataceae cyanobacterium]
MEPFELGMLAAGAAKGAKWIWNNGGEKVAQEATIGTLRAAKTRLPEAARTQVEKLGSRIQARLPQEKNPWDEPELLAQMVEPEVLEPEVLEAVETVTAEIAPMTIENWKGINVKGSGHNISGNTLNIS